MKKLQRRNRTKKSNRKPRKPAAALRFRPDVMPQTYGGTLSKAEIHELAEYLVASTPAKL